MLDHENLELNNLNKIFQFERVSRDIDTISNVEDLKRIAKYFVKMYYMQQEALQPIPIDFKNFLGEYEFDEE